jgi:hypothetical protein
MSRNTKESEAFRLETAMILKREINAYAKRTGRVIAPAELLEHVPGAARVAAQTSGLFAVPLEKPSDADAALPLNQKQYAAPVRHEIERLLKEMQDKRVSSGDQRWEAREVEDIKNLGLLLRSKPQLRNELVADVCFALSGLFEKRPPEAIDNLKFEKEVKSSILLAAEPMWAKYRHEFEGILPEDRFSL